MPRECDTAPFSLVGTPEGAWLTADRPSSKEAQTDVAPQSQKITGAYGCGNLNDTSQTSEICVCASLTKANTPDKH